jgi:hypothetical protein
MNFEFLMHALDMIHSREHCMGHSATDVLHKVLADMGEAKVRKA